jgi:hypothetical protein
MGMIVAQLIAAHNATMECYRRAMIGEPRGPARQPQPSEEAVPHHGETQGCDVGPAGRPRRAHREPGTGIVFDPIVYLRSFESAPPIRYRTMNTLRPFGVILTPKPGQPASQ